MRSLAARVALASALTVAVAGVSVALVSTMLADRIHRAQADAHVMEAARTLAFELSEEGATPAAAVADENRELAHAGIRVAIDREGVRIAGASALPSPTADACAENDTLRACAVASGPWTVIAAHDLAPWHEQRAATGTAAAIAVLVTTLLGALASMLVARSLLAPLARLQRAVEHLDTSRPSEVHLGNDEQLEEIDALRVALRTTLERLSLSLTRSRRFARDAAHELRTPLATMLGELELAVESLPAGSREEVARAHRVALRLSALVERLLVLARAEEPPEVLETLPLREIAETVREELPSEARERVVVTGVDGSVRGDRALLQAMLGNAFDNALKFSRGEVHVELEVEGAHVVCTVSDEGPGLTAEERGRVFEPFHRSATARASGVPGHGIGLALVQHVAAIHGGSAQFADAERGARLVLTLPRAEPAHGDQPGRVAVTRKTV